MVARTGNLLDDDDDDDDQRSDSMKSQSLRQQTTLQIIGAAITILRSGSRQTQNYLNWNSTN